MLFNSYVFIFAFLPVTLAGYFLLGALNQTRFAKMWLAAASLFFYGWWNPAFLLLLGASILVNFWFGGNILKQYRLGNRHASTSLMTIGVVFNLALLAYFKYAGFLAMNLESISGFSMSLGAIFLPLAISFFTFQQIAYLVDASRGEVDEYSFVDYVLFVTFFPQLIAGPIVHHRQMMPQFNDKAFRPQADHLSIGMTFFIVGMMKKVLIADNVNFIADPVFSGEGAPPGLIDAWGGTLAYTVGIYFDFSGYSDMAVGLARMFGIRLPYNFDSPYKSRSIVEFWRRWHITLSTFLRDYLYIALGGNRKGEVRRYANLMITMVLGGLWHGAGWTFVIWGGLHGGYLLINHAWNHVAKKRAAEGKTLKLGALPAQAITLLAVMVAWVFFRAPNFEVATDVLSGMAGLNGKISPQAYAALYGSEFFRGLDNLLWFDGAVKAFDQAAPWMLLGLGIVIALFMPNSQEFIDGAHAKQKLDAIKRRLSILRWEPNLGWAAALSVGFILSLSSMGKVQEFIYFQF